MGDNIQSKVAVKSMVVSSSVTPAPPENVGGLQELANGAGERRPSQAQLPAAAASPSKGTSSSANNNVVGVHYKIGRKIGEGSFGIIYEGRQANESSRSEGHHLPVSNQYHTPSPSQVLIYLIISLSLLNLSQGNQTRPSCATNIVHTKSWPIQVGKILLADS